MYLILATDIAKMQSIKDKPKDFIKTGFVARMVKKWLTWINYTLAGAIALLLLAALYYVWMNPSEFVLPDITARKSNLPKGAFARQPKEYESIGSPSLELAFSPLSVQLPDLRRHLIYYGINNRPDAKSDRPMLYFAFTGNKTPVPVALGDRLYVMYDKSQNPPQYIFSPDNSETPLWIQTSVQGSQAIVKVGMKSDNGQLINEPAAYAEFTLPEKEFMRFSGTVWELGKWRVDGTLLARQKARWNGVDKFIEEHGGDEYKAWEHKQRIDFGEGEESYSVYVNQGDCLSWHVDRWEAIKPGDTSRSLPLMCIKKVDERIMNLEVWDIDGKGKVVLNLVKATEAWAPQALEQNFKFLGARTRSQFVFEINQERILLRPHDWLVLIDGSWKKLQTPQEIDDFVERKIVGPLFVFDHIERKDDRQRIIGELFNAARTEKVVVELALQQGANPATGPAQKNPADEKKQKSRETNAPPMINNVGKPQPHPKPHGPPYVPYAGTNGAPAPGQGLGQNPGGVNGRPHGPGPQGPGPQGYGPDGPDDDDD